MPIPQRRRSWRVGAGFYLSPGLIPGSYRLSVAVPGMEKYEVTFTVQVAQSVVIDPVLKLGQTTTTVEVTDVTPMATVDNPTVRATLEHARIDQAADVGLFLSLPHALVVHEPEGPVLAVVKLINADERRSE